MTNPLEEPIDYILLAGRRSPGLAVLTGAGSPRKWDPRRGYGLSGGTLIFRGNDFSRFNCTLRLVTTEDWDDWSTFKDIVQRPPLGERARAKDIWHPFLEDLGITSVVVQDVLQPAREGDTNIWSVVIKFIEFRRPQITLSQPEASDTEEDDPNSRRIAALTQIVENNGEGSILQALATE